MPKITVQSHPETTIVGLKYHGKGLNQEIPQLWGMLGERRDEIQDLDEAVHAAYGISIMDEDFLKTMVFDYIAGFPVKEKGLEQPEDMAAFTIPAGTYATAVCPNLGAIQEAFDAVTNRWLPESAYVQDFSKGNFVFERYGEEFMPESGSEKFSVFVPVREK